MNKVILLRFKMNNAALKDIKNLIEEEYSDLESADFLEFFNEIKKYGQELADMAQSKINKRVEKLVDSFGEDISLRQLKGE